MRVGATRATFLVALLGAASGCSDDEPDSGCPPENVIAGVCAGVPAGELCAEDVCTSALPCAATVTVGDDAALASAAAAASAGTCIALLPGKYGAVTLPGGVSLLGKSAGAVVVGDIAVQAGDATVLRGLTAPSVRLTGATGARLEAVRLTGAAEHGLWLEAGAAATVVTSEISVANKAGVYGVDGTEVAIDRSVIAGNRLGGIRTECSTGCDCVAATKLALTTSIVRDNVSIGVAISGASAELSTVSISGTLPDPQLVVANSGGGLVASRCSELTATGLGLHANAGYGALLVETSADLDDIEVSANVIGLWLGSTESEQNATPLLHPVDIANAIFSANKGVGIGMGGEKMGGPIVVHDALVADTSDGQLPVAGMAGSDHVGDAIVWRDGANVTLDGLTASGSARSSVLIDGPASGSIANVTLSSGDEGKGLVQQRYQDGAQPTIGPNAPALTLSATELYSVALPPVALEQL